MRLVLAVLIVVGIGVCAVGARESWRGWSAHGWPQVPAHITRSEVLTRGGATTTYVPVIEYRYRIGEAVYVGRRVRVCTHYEDNEAYAQQETGRYPLDAEVIARVSPTDARDAVLEPGVGLECGIFAAVGAALALIPGWLLWRARAPLSREEFAAMAEPARRARKVF